jgi:hypothetical protein
MMEKKDVEKKVVPADAVGQVTVETTQPSGETSVQTMPASEAKKQ